MKQASMVRLSRWFFNTVEVYCDAQCIRYTTMKQQNEKLKWEKESWHADVLKSLAIISHDNCTCQGKSQSNADPCKDRLAYCAILSSLKAWHSWIPWAVLNIFGYDITRSSIFWVLFGSCLTCISRHLEQIFGQPLLSFVQFCLRNLV